MVKDFVWGEIVAAQFYYSHSSKIANQRPLFGICPEWSAVQKLSMSTHILINAFLHNFFSREHYIGYNSTHNSGKKIFIKVKFLVLRFIH